MREGKHTGEGGTIWRDKLRVIEDMELELNHLGHTITNASFKTESGWRGRSRI
jgi:hypothetical protein